MTVTIVCPQCGHVTRSHRIRFAEEEHELHEAMHENLLTRA